MKTYILDLNHKKHTGIGSHSSCTAVAAMSPIGKIIENLGEIGLIEWAGQIGFIEWSKIVLCRAKYETGSVKKDCNEDIYMIFDSSNALHSGRVFF